MTGMLIDTLAYQCISDWAYRDKSYLCGRELRGSGSLATHVLEVRLSLETSAFGSGRIAIAARVERPAAGPGA